AQTVFWNSRNITSGGLLPRLRDHVRAAPGRGVRGPPGRPQLHPPAAGASQDGPPGRPVDLPAALSRPAGRSLPARREDLPDAGLPAAAGQPGPRRQPARAAQAEGPGADEPEADGDASLSEPSIR